jgi:hypothetical protein
MSYDEPIDDSELISELDELTVLDCGCTGTIRTAESSGGMLVCEDHFRHPEQLPRFVDHPNAARRAFIHERGRKELIASLMGGLRELVPQELPRREDTFPLRISDDYVWHAEYENALLHAFTCISIDLYWDEVWWTENGLSRSLAQ